MILFDFIILQVSVYKLIIKYSIKMKKNNLISTFAKLLFDENEFKFLNVICYFLAPFSHK
jgi:hypothetical protein